MKAWFLFFSILLTSIICFAQDTLVKNNHTVFYYPNGVKSSEGTLIDGKPNGWWVSYNTDGQIISQGNRKNFQLDSLWTFFNDNGDIIRTVHYQEDKKEGKQVIYNIDDYVVSQWHEDSIVGSVETYDNAHWLKNSVPYVDGKAHGLGKTYNQEGLVVAVTKYYHGIMSRTERINRTDNAGLKQGNWKYFWDNGNLKLEATYLNGKKHGFFKFYDEAGNFLYIEKYDHDQLVEDAKETKQLEKRMTYHPNGRPAIIVTYYKDKPDGIRREFDTAGNVIKGYVFENGWLRYEGITDMNGLRQGLWKEYYPTGELRSKGRYKNSNPVGEWNFYFTDKSIEITGNYDNKGHKDGEWIWFYPSGDTMSVAEYGNGEFDGRYIEYDEEGEPLVKGNYVAGLEEGIWMYRNGTSIESGKYDGGLREGVWKITFDDNRIAFEIHYDQDVRDGKYTAFWENGAVKTSGKYKQGLQDGPWNFYNEDGILTLTTLFKDGNEIKWNNYTIN